MPPLVATPSPPIPPREPSICAADASEDAIASRADESIGAIIASMWTVGVDLSAENTKTCLASIDWRTDCAYVDSLQTNVSNEAIVTSAGAASKIGIDCPFGWPVPFLEFITEHDRGDVRARDGLPIAWRRELANRRTDLFIRDVTGLIPLSVSADRIAHAAMRCAALLAELASNGVPVDRTGQTGKVVEVYPAASLFQWGLTPKGYKRAARTAELNELVDTLLGAAPWLDLGEYEDFCRSDDDAFDAVIASLTARAAVCNRTIAPTSEHAVLAAREGWIALPLKGSLDQLAAPP